MTDAELDEFLDAAARALRLTIAPEWRAEVRQNLLVLFLQGERVLDFPLPDEAEAAPIFTAGPVLKP
jgi:hypothetical protein